MRTEIAGAGALEALRSGRPREASAGRSRAIFINGTTT